MNKHTPLMSAHNHYSLRKMSIGLVSVLLGTSLYLGVSQSNAQAAASPAVNTAETSAVKADSDAKAKTPTSSNLNKEVTPASAAKPALQLESNAPAPKSEDKAGIEQADKQASNDQKADQSTALNLKGQKSPKLSEKGASASAKEEKGLKPKLLKSEADPEENGLKLRQQTPDGKASLAWVYTDSSGAEQKGHNKLGSYENGRPIHLSFFINDQPGTQWSLSIPVADGKEYSINYQTPNPSQTTFTHVSATDADPYETFSGAIVTTKTMRIQFTLTPMTNSIGFDPGKTPISTGSVQHQVTWSINKVAQTPLDFINQISPAFIHPFTGRVKDNSSNPYDVYANDDPTKDEIYPGADYQYILDLNETPGITDADSFHSGKVNQVVNNGTTITIPVPTGFVLDHDLTMSRNNFSDKDQTTITQPGGKGHNIIINVPPKSGVQYWNGSLTPYYIIGKYDIAIPAGNETLKASPGSKITIVQRLKGSDVLTAELDPWEEKTSGTTRPVISGKTLINIGPAEVDQNLPLGDVHDKILTYFGFKNQTGLPLNDQNKLKITLNMGDGLAVKQIKTPKSNTLLSGTTSYAYTVSYWNDPTPDTGTVAAGSSVSAPTGKLIKSIVLTPNYWTPIGGTEDAPGNATIYSQNSNTVDFQAIGDLADTYQANGQPVKAGDEIESSITAAITLQGKTTPITNSTHVDQKVVTAAKVPAELDAYHVENSKAAGAEKAGYAALITTSGSKSKYIQSPTFYYVLPQNAQVAKNADGSWDIDGFNHDDNEDVTTKPEITVFKVGDRQVVKLDYSKTGYKFNTALATNNMVHLDNLTNVLNGTDYGYIYIVSPTTEINTSHNPAIDISNIKQSVAAPKTHDFDPAWIENTSKNVYLVGSFDWQIDQAAAANTPTTAAGNKDAALNSQTGKSDDKGQTQMQYAIEIVNNDSNRLQNIDQIINLPTATDNNGSFTFNLTQPISLISGQSIPYQVKYSDQPAVLTTDQNSRPDITGYKDWDQFADKSKIRSAVIILNSLPADSTVGKFLLTGEDPTIAQDAGKTGTLASGAYIDNLIPFVIDENNHADEAASIKVSGQSTIKFRYHYKDSDGTDQYINIPSASKTYNDNEDAMLSKADAQAIAEANKDLIPTSYRSDLNSDPSKIEVSIIEGGKTWQSNAANDKADFGKQVKYYFDSDIVQFELTPNTPTPPVKQDQTAELRFYDDDTHSFITAAPDQTATGKTGDPISFTNGSQQTQTLLDGGYEFVGITKGADPDSTNFLTKSKYQDADFGTFDNVDDPANAAPSQIFIVHLKKKAPDKPGNKPGGGGDQPGHNPGGNPGNKPGNKPSNNPKPGNNPNDNPGNKPSSKPGNKPNGKPATPSQPSSVPSKQSKPSPIIKQNHNATINNGSKASKPGIMKKAQPAQFFQSKRKLPQTGNKAQPLALLGLGLLTLAAIIGLAADRKH